MSTPKFKHDCDRCNFLGRHEETDSDLYYCRQYHKVPTLVARYSDDPVDYSSGLSFVATMPEIAEANRLAVAAGHFV